MPMPTVLSQTGTGTVIWTGPDWMQTPFVVGIGLVNGSTGVNGTATIDACLQSFDTAQATSVATSSATAWFTVVGPTSATSTLAICSTPCLALRLNVITATATSAFTVNFVQATFGR